MLKTTGDAKMQNDWVVVGLKKGIFWTEPYFDLNYLFESSITLDRKSY